MTDPDYVVWSFEHEAWWGPARWGYTLDLAEAGRYTRAEAEDIVTHANQYRDTPYEALLPLAEALVTGPPTQL